MALDGNTLIIGTVQVTAKVNIRSGAPNTTAPLLRKVAPGIYLNVYGSVTGEKVHGISTWYRLENNSFVWSGACGGIQANEPPPVPSPPDPRFQGLDPDFAAKLQTLLETCASQGYEFRISQGLRPPAVQAEYYCRWEKRTPADIDAVVAKLRSANANWTADLVARYRDIARQKGWLTNALPGAGWHQWGQAADCYCYRDGKMVESAQDACYKTYAEIAKSLGLTPGYYFSHQDAGHVQMRPEGGATDIYSWAYIDETMRQRFGDKPALN